MKITDNRTALLLIGAVILLIWFFNSGSLLNLLSLVQSVAITALAIVATLYLWKRL